MEVWGDQYIKLARLIKHCFSGTQILPVHNVRFEGQK